MLRVLARMNRRLGLRGIVHYDDVADSVVSWWKWSRGGEA